ncbi:hypothetical protein ACSBR1_039101 [Camellia fascicularis]
MHRDYHALVEAAAHVETVIDSVGQDKEEESIPTSSTVWRGSRPTRLRRSQVNLGIEDHLSVFDMVGQAMFGSDVLWRSSASFSSPSGDNSEAGSMKEF